MTNSTSIVLFIYTQYDTRLLCCTLL